MKHYGYLVMLIFTLFGSLWLEFIFQLKVLQQLKRLMITIFPIASLYLVWDALATRFTDWGFDPRQILGIKPLFSLPIEEIAFFVVVPIAAILTLEAVLNRKKHWRV